MNDLANPEPSLAEDAGTSSSYEVIRQRLVEQARELARRAEALNSARRAVFGGTELKLLGSERVRTEHNTIPRDLASVGGHLLLGYSVFMGLKTETRVEDVFSLCRFAPIADGWDLGTVTHGAAARSFLEDSVFVREFNEVFKFYKQARLVRLTSTETLLLAAFQIGETLSDVRVFRWAKTPDGPPRYVDNRGERDYALPNQHGFEWQRATREDYVTGPFPHVSIEDELFVETTGGTLTIKLENNTQTGEGVVNEPVEDPRQGLDDAVFEHARSGGLILLKILPYRESSARHFVYSPRTRVIARVDAIGRACVPLPEDQGVVFPGGYCLADGTHKVFPGNYEKFVFERSVRSPNGEDVLFVFYEPELGEYALFAYNLIEKTVLTPILCNGYSLFDDGRLVVFREQTEPTRVHPVQIWQTPFCSSEHEAGRPPKVGALGKIGNTELVRAISDALGVRRSVEDTTPSRRTYEALVQTMARVLDSYHWLGDEETFDLRSVLFELRQSAEQIISEFDKVLALRERAELAIVAAEKQQKALIAGLRVDSLKSAEQFMRALGDLRTQRGHVISLRELRYADRARLDALEAEAGRELESLSRATLTFLSGETALSPLLARLRELETAIGLVQKSSELAELTRDIERTSQGVVVLSEVVGGLKSDDATVRTAVLERIAEAFSLANRVRALLEGRRKALATEEGRAEFAIQLQLFRQSVDGALVAATTPEQCDEQLSRLSLQLEELEARFSDLTEFSAELHEQREQLHEALGQKRQNLIDERQRRAAGVLAAAERVLSSLKRRAESYEDEVRLNAFFASDPMIEKLLSLAERLVELGDAPKADELRARLRSSREGALRLLRDRAELLEQGGDVIRLGRHRFAVNRQSLELTTLLEDGRLVLCLAGTDYREVLTDPELASTEDLWAQHLVSETEHVYRAEYLAGSLLFAAERGGGGLSLARLHEAAREPNGLLGLVQKEAQSRYDEGYERGQHDADAALILEKLLLLRESAGVLGYSPRARARATLYLAFQGDHGKSLRRRAQSFARLREVFPTAASRSELTDEVSAELRRFFEAQSFACAPELALEAAEYLVHEVGRGEVRLRVRKSVVDAVENFERELELRGARSAFLEDLQALEADLRSAFELTREWLRGYLAERSRGEEPVTEELLEETAAVLLARGRVDFQATSALTSLRVDGLLGEHPRIHGRSLELRLDEFNARLRAFSLERVPRYRAYRELRQKVLERHRERLRLTELTPKPMAGFVRNRLINEVYLPLVGENLAKQIGSTGEHERTDRMGLLLVISPPGYGKTTLMEYVAGRLGLIFVKVNGPALGHTVTSLDPAEAPNRTARQEVEKINLALEMGNNVMLYLDDIQHTNPELLQKFISLCDAQRRIEGVWNNRSRTYDLRGKRFCVVMAGNPYTESGERFKIPDMLANRADTYNLGDILSGKDELFALSYVENALTSNPVLAPLAGRDAKDVYLLIRMAQGENIATSELSHGYSRVELDEILGLFQRLFRVQRVLLDVNRTYIQSASTEDRFRTEPAFKLQGSYRNACKLAEKLSSALTPQELERLILDHYAGEAQTLTTGAEHNLLKLGLLLGSLTQAQSERWEEIVLAFRRSQLLGGAEEDPVTRVTRQLGALGVELEGIHVALRNAIERQKNGELSTRLERVDTALERLAEARFEIQVKNEPPPGVDQLLNQQISIMEHTLLPFVKVATQRLDDSHELRVQLDELIISLKRIDETLRRQARERSTT